VKKIARPISVRLGEAVPPRGMIWREAHESPFPAGRIFQGFSRGELWNGWEMPFFEYREAKRVAGELYRLHGYVVPFSNETRSFYMHNEQGLPEESDYAAMDDRNIWSEIPMETIATSNGIKSVWSFDGLTWLRAEP